MAIAPIGDDPEYRAALAELQALEARLAETERRRQRALARLRGTKSPRNPLDRARDLLAGGVVGAVDPKDDLTACEEEQYAILRPALVAANRQLNEIAAELSFAASKQVQPAYRQALVAMFAAMQDLCAAVMAANALRARLHELGYTPSEVVLPFAVPPGLATLDPNNLGNSWAWRWKQVLLEQGVL